MGLTYYDIFSGRSRYSGQLDSIVTFDFAANKEVGRCPVLTIANEKIDALGAGVFSCRPIFIVDNHTNIVYIVYIPHQMIIKCGVAICVRGNGHWFRCILLYVALRSETLATPESKAIRADNWLHVVFNTYLYLFNQISLSLSSYFFLCEG